ncbi:hypothetical protein NKZ81_04860 [Streptococcus suis]|uniref:hypothetical protein n=1 Tax=Streptococcus suis TaxID=1307 RepID=UPI0020B8C6DF|nr:hypothetical protein [Streptococcus suis]UTH67793.1 hypothetical protein NKZ81_04860 [Streptococcus suis]
MYIFETTEQNNSKANDFETKSLLYLMSFKSDSTDIDTFFVDCFNDTTGASSDLLKLWDVQAKNISSLRPKTIGKSLITLFQNFISSVNFYEYILFIPKLKENYLMDISLTEFKIDNFKDIAKIQEGLEEEYKRRKKLGALSLKQLSQLNTFLEQIHFVTGDSSKAIYIKNIIQFKSNIRDDNFFESVFNEVRSKQTELKNINIHNISINSIEEVLKLNKHLTKRQLETLVVNRIIGVELFKQRIPNDFFDVINDKSSSDRKDIIQDCNANLSRLLFDKNSNKKKFWSLLEQILILVEEKDDIYQILNRIKQYQIPKIINEDYTLLYLISMVKEGMEENAC